MKFLRWLSLSACVLSLVPSSASADEPSLATQVQRQVEDGFVKPLVAYQASISRFSRGRMPPRERRVRVTQTTPSLDKSGRAFVAFAVDAKLGSEWHENDLVGCAYTKGGDIFVKTGDTYRPASFLLGKPADPVDGVCKAAPVARS